MKLSSMKFPRKLRHGSGVPMSLDSSRLLIALRKKCAPQEAARLLLRVGLVPEGSEEVGRPRAWAATVNHTDKRLWFRTRNGRPINQLGLEAVRKRLGTKLDWIGPVYVLPGSEGLEGRLCPLPNVLLIKPVAPLEIKAKKGFAATLRRYGLKEVTPITRYLNDYRYCRIDAQAKSAY